MGLKTSVCQAWCCTILTLVLMQVNQLESEASLKILGYKNETLSQKHQCTRLLDMYSNNKTLSPIAYTLVFSFSFLLLHGSLYNLGAPSSTSPALSRDRLCKHSRQKLLLPTACFLLLPFSVGTASFCSLQTIYLRLSDHTTKFLDW